MVNGVELADSVKSLVGQGVFVALAVIINLILTRYDSIASSQIKDQKIKELEDKITLIKAKVDMLNEVVEINLNRNKPSNEKDWLNNVE
jgi:hypothetical protein